MKSLIKYTFEKIDKVYYFLAILRIILTLIPQTGYIHPDEFFQSIEIMAGDVFDVESSRPWEFNSTYPIRSIFTPYIMIGIPYSFLKMIDLNLRYYFDLSLRTPYFLLIFPRLYLCIFSFIIDYCLYKICRINSERFGNKLLILGSSYVMLVYGTHTFSNSLEMILMAILLYLVVDSQTYSHAIIRQDVYLTKKYKETKKSVEKARIYKMKASLPSYTMRNCLLISFIIVTGIFNRPTFAVFAFPSVFFWIHRGIGFKMVQYSDIHYRMILFIFSSLLFTSLFVIIDSFYFGYLSSGELLQMDITINNFVATPLNFLKYNVDENMLARHGLHPKYTHLLVNIPILYNILGILAIGGFLMLFYRLIFKQFTDLPRVHSIRFLMSTSIILPVAVLSYFPHQEPRFLIPITLPLVYLYSDIIATNKKILMRLWWTFNIFCLLFFGFFHQGGIVQLASYMKNELSVHQPVHLVASHVYSFPISLLTQRNTRKLYGHGSSKYLLSKTFIVYEMGSSQSMPAILKLLNAIEHVQNKNKLQKKYIKRDITVYLTLPISKESELIKYINDTTDTLMINKIASFYPHFSTEAMPDIFYNPCDENFDENCTSFSVAYVTDYLINFCKSFGLGLYKFHKKISEINEEII